MNSPFLVLVLAAGRAAPAMRLCPPSEAGEDDQQANSVVLATAWTIDRAASTKHR